MSVIDIPENVHKIIVKKQSELYEIDGKKTNLSEIAANSILKGINEKKIDVYFKDDSTNELMNNISSYLLKNNYITTSENCGVQECSKAIRDFEIYIIEKF